MEFGYIVVLRRGISSPPYELDLGEHTIGSAKNSNIRLKIKDPLLLQTHAIIQVNEDGVATIVNNSTTAPVKVNGNVIYRPTILKHKDIFLVLEKEFHYFNDKLKDESESSDLFTKAKTKLLAGSRKSVMPLSKVPAKSTSDKTKESASKKFSPRILNTSLGAALKQSVKTPVEKNFKTTSTRRSMVAAIYSSTPSIDLDTSNTRRNIMPKEFLSSAKTPIKEEHRKSLTTKDILSNVQQTKDYKDDAKETLGTSRLFSRVEGDEDIDEVLNNDSESPLNISRRNIRSQPNVNDNANNTLENISIGSTKGAKSFQRSENVQNGSLQAINVSRRSGSSKKNIEQVFSPVKPLSSRKSARNSQQEATSTTIANRRSSIRSSLKGQILESSSSMSALEQSTGSDIPTSPESSSSSEKADSSVDNKEEDTGTDVVNISTSTRTPEIRKSIRLGLGMTKTPSGTKEGVVKSASTTPQMVGDVFCTSPIVSGPNSRETTVDAHQNSSTHTRVPRSSRSSNRIISIFDESTQDNNLNISKGSSQNRKSTFEESTQEALPNKNKDKSMQCDVDDIGQVLSPVKPLSSRKSARCSQDDVSTTNLRTSIRVSLRGQTSENSSLSMSALELSTSPATSISSQSFSSFKKTDSNVDDKKDDSEIDVLNITTSTRTPEISSRMARTPSGEEEGSNSREDTIDAHQNSTDSSVSRSFFRASKRITSTFDASVQDNNLNSSKKQSQLPKSTFEESSQEVLSLVKPISPRKSAQYAQDDISAAEASRRSMRGRPKKQISESSSLTMTSLRESTGSAISISSQSFSSFKKSDSSVDKKDDTEIDVVNITTSTRKSARFSSRMVKTLGVEEGSAEVSSTSTTVSVSDSREVTIDVHQNSKNSSVSRRSVSKRVTSTFDESTQDNNLISSKRKAQSRKSTFDESMQAAMPNVSKKSMTLDVDDVEQVLSPVKPISTRKSAQYPQDDVSGTVVSRKSSLKGTPKKQISESSSLTMTSLRQRTGSAIFVSSQSFSSFIKSDSSVDKKDDIEIDVVNTTTSTSTPEIRKSSRFSSRMVKTPSIEKGVLKYPSAGPQMFDDVSCTSTPFQKSFARKNALEFAGTDHGKDVAATDTSTTKTLRKSSSNPLDMLVTSSTNVAMNSPKLGRSRSASTLVEITEEVPKRRSSRSVSRSGDKSNCVLCNHSTVKKKTSDLDGSSTKNRQSEDSSEKNRSKPVASRTESPLILRKSHILSSCVKTPEKSETTQDETPKSHVKPTRRSSKANQSAYNPVLEDITPVTPEPLQGADYSEESFKTPVNTPGLFESIRKSAVRSRKRHRESNGSILKSSKRPKVDDSADDYSSQMPELEAAVNKKSPVNRLSDFEGVKKMLRTPAKSPKNDLTSVSGVENLFNVSGVEVLHHGSDIENSDLFTKLTGKRPIKAYLRSKTLSPIKRNVHDDVGAFRKSMGDLPVCSPRIQQWIDEHADYNQDKDESSSVGEGDVFANMSENPKRKPRVGRSISPKKAGLEEKNRRNTLIVQLKNTPNIAERNQKRKSEKQEDISGHSSNMNEDLYNSDLENMTDGPRKMPRLGRSISPKKSIQSENRRKTHGYVLKYTPDVNRWKSQRGGENTPDTSGHKNRTGRSLSVLTDNQNDNSHRKSQDDLEDITEIKNISLIKAKPSPTVAFEGRISRRNSDVTRDALLQDPDTQEPLETVNRDLKRKRVSSDEQPSTGTGNLDSHATQRSNKRTGTRRGEKINGIPSEKDKDSPDVTQKKPTARKGKKTLVANSPAPAEEPKEILTRTTRRQKNLGKDEIRVETPIKKPVARKAKGKRTIAVVEGPPVENDIDSADTEVVAKITRRGRNQKTAVDTVKLVEGAEASDVTEVVLETPDLLVESVEIETTRSRRNNTRRGMLKTPEVAEVPKITRRGLRKNKPEVIETPQTSNDDSPNISLIKTTSTPIVAPEQQILNRSSDNLTVKIGTPLQDTVEKYTQEPLKAAKGGAKRRRVPSNEELNLGTENLDSHVAEYSNKRTRTRRGQKINDTPDEKEKTSPEVPKKTATRKGKKHVSTSPAAAEEPKELLTRATRRQKNLGKDEIRVETPVKKPVARKGKGKQTIAIDEDPPVEENDTDSANTGVVAKATRRGRKQKIDDDSTKLLKGAEANEIAEELLETPEIEDIVRPKTRGRKKGQKPIENELITASPIARKGRRGGKLDIVNKEESSDKTEPNNRIVVDEEVEFNRSTGRSRKGKPTLEKPVEVTSPISRRTRRRAVLVENETESASPMTKRARRGENKKYTSEESEVDEPVGLSKKKVHFSDVIEVKNTPKLTTKRTGKTKK